MKFHDYVENHSFDKQEEQLKYVKRSWMRRGVSKNIKIRGNRHAGHEIWLVRVKILNKEVCFGKWMYKEAT